MKRITISLALLLPLAGCVTAPKTVATGIVVASDVVEGQEHLVGLRGRKRESDFAGMRHSTSGLLSRRKPEFPEAANLCMGVYPQRRWS